MIISKTPYRISFFGGGTDYPKWYNKHGGQVISTTIDKYLYTTCRYLPPFFEHRLRFAYSRDEAVMDSKDLIHPSARETLKFMNIKNGIEIHYDGDFPARSGLGSSSAFTVGLLNALYSYMGKKISKKKLTLDSINIEQKIIKENVGSQDQTSASYGGFNKIIFSKNNIVVKKIDISQYKLKKLEKNLMLFYTGIRRTADKIAKEYINNIKDNEVNLNNMKNQVDTAIKILKNGDLNDFGLLLNEAWQFKKSLSSRISNNFLNDIYDEGIKAGALGGKLLGAGAGGFMLFYAPEINQKKIKSKLKSLLHIPFKFENNGSQIIFKHEFKRYDREELDRDNFKQNYFKDIDYD